MHLRKLVLACGFATLALSNSVSALGLGEVKLKSALNQPLSAEIQLLDAKGLTSEQIIVALASNADFERNGVERVHFYSEFQFQVVLDGPSGPVIRITTANAVREPYLNFLIDAKWTSGRLLREYTLLMDLPTFDDASAQAVVAPVVSEAPGSKSTESSAESVSQEPTPDIISEQESAVKKPKSASGTYGPIGDKDTLWDIARSVGMHSGASIHQTMLALQRLNPDAFIHGNINLIKKGHVLRLPGSDEVNKLSKSEAVAQFNQQNSQLSSVATPSSNLGAQLDATSHAGIDAHKEEVASGRVKLAAPGGKSKASEGQGSGSNKGSGKALESELASALEELDRAKSEKTELSSRVHDLEDQVNTMQRLVDVSNEKLHALQVNATKHAETSIASVGASSKPNTVAAKSVESTAQSVEAVSSVVAAAPVSSKAAAPVKPAIKPVAQKPEPSMLDQLMANPMLIAAGLAGIGLAGGGFIAWRRRKSAEEEAARWAQTDPLPESEPDFEPFNSLYEESPDIEPLASAPISATQKDSSVFAETGDVVSEADIYISFGQFDKAEEMLLNGLAKDSDALDIRTKLLEVYSQTQNATEFDKHYSVLLPLASEFVLARAAELRQDIYGIGEFVSVPSSTDVSEFEESDFDLVDQEERKLPSSEFNFELASESPDENTSLSVEELEFTAEKLAVADNDSADSGDFNFDFDLSELETEALKAEDLSEISMALDSLDVEDLPDDIEISGRDDEFTFDFNEMDDTFGVNSEPEELAASTLLEEPGLPDDFNLEMDVDSVDLAQLESEIASFDADLDILEDPLVKLSADESAVDVIDSVSDVKPSVVVADSLDLADELVDSDFAGLEFESLAELELPAEIENAETDLDWELDEMDDISSIELSSVESADFPLAEEAELELDDDVSVEDLEVEEIEPHVDSLEIASEEESLPDDPEMAFEELALLDEPIVSDEELTTSDLLVEELPVVLDEPILDEENIFDAALSDIDIDSLSMDASDIEDFSEPLADNELDVDSDFDFMSDVDEAATKLDLARAYIDMGDNEGARDILAEVAHEGSEQQRLDAMELLSRINA